MWHFTPPSLLKQKCDRQWEYRVADGYAHYPRSSQQLAQTMLSVSRRDASLEVQRPCTDCENQMNKGKISNSRKKIRFLLLFLFLHVEKRVAMAGVDLQCRTGESACYCLFSAFKPGLQKPIAEADPDGGARPHLAKKKVVDLLLRACTWHALQANVREQRLVIARTSVPHVDSSRVSDVYPCLAWDWPRRLKFLLGLLSRFRHLDKPVSDSQNERTCAQRKAPWAVDALPGAEEEGWAWRRCTTFGVQHWNPCRNERLDLLELHRVDQRHLHRVLRQPQRRDR